MPEFDTLQQEHADIMRRMMGLGEGVEIPDRVAKVYERMKHLLDVVDHHELGLESLAVCIAVGDLAKDELVKRQPGRPRKEELAEAS